MEEKEKAAETRRFGTSLKKEVEKEEKATPKAARAAKEEKEEAKAAKEERQKEKERSSASRTTTTGRPARGRTAPSLTFAPGAEESTPSTSAQTKVPPPRLRGKEPMEIRDSCKCQVNFPVGT